MRKIVISLPKRPSMGAFSATGLLGVALLGVAGAPQAQTRAVSPPAAAASGAPAAAPGARPLGATPGAAIVQSSLPGPGALPTQSIMPGQPMMAPAQPQPMAANNAPLPSPKVTTPPDLVNEVIEQTAPLTPAELTRLRKELNARQTALTENITGKPPVKPSSQIFQLDLSPNAVAAPPVVRVTPGQGAVVSFLDATGKPWPIVVADNANPDGGVVVSKFTDHQLSVFVKNNTVLGNVLVALRDLPTAIGFSVVAGQDRTDYQVQMVVPRFKDGVPANVISQGSLPAVGSSDLFDFLLRTPPQTAKQLRVDGLPGATAWQTSPSKMVIRTEATLTEAMRHFSIDGVGVYEVRLSPLVIGTLNGRYVQLRVSGY